MKHVSAQNTSNSLTGETVTQEHPNATANRLRKIEAMAESFHRHGITAALGRKMTDDEWEIAAKAVGINSPSKLTREGVLRRLAHKV